jgi:hypothetical protein
MPYWDERVEAMAKHYPDVTWDKYHIDILTAHFVLNPDRFDVVVASNLFGDILSDLGPACTGTIGIAPSANINPERNFRRCSSRCTARRRTSTARASPTRSARSGRRDDARPAARPQIGKSLHREGLCSNGAGNRICRQPPPQRRAGAEITQRKP